MWGVLYVLLSGRYQGSIGPTSVAAPSVKSMRSDLTCAISEFVANEAFRIVSLLSLLSFCSFLFRFLIVEGGRCPFPGFSVEFPAMMTLISSTFFWVHCIVKNNGCVIVIVRNQLLVGRMGNICLFLRKRKRLGGGVLFV